MYVANTVVALPQPVSAARIQNPFLMWKHTASLFRDKDSKSDSR